MHKMQNRFKKGYRMGKKFFRRYLGLLFLIWAVSGQTVWAAETVTDQQSASSQDQQTEESETTASPYAERLQNAKDALRHKEAGKYGMVPIYPGDIVDGTYEIEVDSSSPFFRITEARLLVDGDEMTAEITISSLSYEYVYMGTAQEAEKDQKSNFIGCREEDGKSIFTIPVEALDQEMDCAAFSKKRQMWYDRKLVFDASTLPEEALLIELPDYELIEMAILAYQVEGSDEESESGENKSTGQGASEAVDIAHSDGEYSIEVNMTGGSGRASISSPTLLTVRDGKAYATLLWSSAYYDYMIVEGETYYNLTTDGGNSTFEIPITVMDGSMPVIADTTAMGDPVEIDYTLTFYSETIGSKGQIPQEAAKKVLVIAVIIIAAGGILNYFVKKKRRG